MANNNFERVHEIGAKEFGGLWLEANMLAVSAVGSTVASKNKYEISRCVLSTLRLAQKRFYDPQVAGLDVGDNLAWARAHGHKG